MKKIKLLFVVTICLCAKYGYSQNVDSVYYHDYSMESQWYMSIESAQSGCFVRFTPTSYPDTLVGARAYFRNANSNSTIRWKVYFDQNSLDNGGVTPVYQTPTPFVNPGDGGNANQQYDIYTDLRAAKIVVTKGDVYVGIVEDTGEDGMGIDTNGTVATDRQWQWQHIFTSDYWNTLLSQGQRGQWGITAFFSSVTTGVPVDAAKSTYVYLGTNDNILHVLLTEQPSNMVVKISDIAGRELSSQTIHDVNTAINMSSFASGVYIVNILSDKNNSSHKVIKL